MLGASIHVKNMDGCGVKVKIVDVIAELEVSYTELVTAMKGRLESPMADIDDLIQVLVEN